MSHKDAPPETESQKACREWWEKARPTVKRAWGRAADGSFLAEETRLIHKAWEAASQQANAEVERLRAEVERLRADRDSWEQQASDRVADWHAEHLRAERLAEALEQCITSMLDSGYRTDSVVIRAAREALAAQPGGAE